MLKEYLNLVHDFIYKFFVDKDLCWLRSIAAGTTIHINDRVSQNIKEKNVQLITLTEKNGKYILSFERVPTRWVSWLPFYTVKWRMLEFLDLTNEVEKSLMPQTKLINIEDKRLIRIFKSAYSMALKVAPLKTDECYVSYIKSLRKIL